MSAAPAHPDPLVAHVLTLARYNAWATGRLLDALAALPDEPYRRDVGLFFKSIHGTLNHLLVAEQALWWARFSRGESPVMALSAELEPDRDRLASRLREGVAQWPSLVERLEPARLHGSLDYRTSKGLPMSLPYGATLMHVFNHGTHHRGQITAALTMLGEPGPELDLVYMLIADQSKS